MLTCEIIEAVLSDLAVFGNCHFDACGLDKAE